MPDLIPWVLPVVIGLVSGVLSGMFGIGGGIVTTPAIRLLLDAPALIAVGTPLPVIVPSAVTGALAYGRRGQADVAAGLTCGAAGVATAIAGAWATGFVGGSTVLIGTAVIIAWAAADVTLQALMPPKQLAEVEDVDPQVAHGAADEVAVLRVRSGAQVTGRRRTGALVTIGLVTGAYSGFFGLGGGFVLVPMLTRWLRIPIKRAIGTSLIGVAVLAIPGTITHAVLGNIDWRMVVGLTVGVIPGAALGARLNAGAREFNVRLGFAVLLIATAAWLIVSELAGLG